jgi:hypothetical protein
LYGLALRNRIEHPSAKNVGSPPRIPEWKVMSDMDSGKLPRDDEELIEIHAPKSS